MCSDMSLTVGNIESYDMSWFSDFALALVVRLLLEYRGPSCITIESNRLLSGNSLKMKSISPLLLIKLLIGLDLVQSVIAKSAAWTIFVPFQQL